MCIVFAPVPECWKVFWSVREELTDDQVMELLKISFRQPEVVLALAKMVHDVHERSNVQNPLE